MKKESGARDAVILRIIPKENVRLYSLNAPQDRQTFHKVNDQFRYFLPCMSFPITLTSDILLLLLLELFNRIVRSFSNQILYSIGNRIGCLECSVPPKTTKGNLAPYSKTQAIFRNSWDHRSNRLSSTFRECTFCPVGCRCHSNCSFSVQVLMYSLHFSRRCLMQACTQIFGNCRLAIPLLSNTINHDEAKLKYQRVDKAVQAVLNCEREFRTYI